MKCCPYLIVGLLIVVVALLPFVAGNTFYFPFYIEQCPSGFPEAIVEAFNENRRQEGIDHPLQLNPTYTYAAWQLNTQNRCNKCPFVASNYRSYGQYFWAMSLETPRVTSWLPSRSAPSMVSYFQDSGRRPWWTGDGPWRKYTKEEWAGVREMGVGCGTYRFRMPITGNTVSMVKIIFTFDKPEGNRVPQPPPYRPTRGPEFVTDVGDSELTPPPPLEPRHTTRIPGPNPPEEEREETEKKYRFNIGKDSGCPVGFRLAMLHQFNKQRLRNGYRPLRISLEATTAYLDLWNLYIDCHRTLGGLFCDRHKEPLANYGIINESFPLHAPRYSLTAEQIGNDPRIRNARPDPVVWRNYHDRYTEEEWREASEMTVFCSPELDESKVDLAFLFNRAKKAEKPEPLQPFEDPTVPIVVDMFVEYIFPLSRDTCPSGFSQAIVGAFNDQRRKEGISGSLSLDSTLSQAASEILEQTRCEDCPLLKAYYPTYGQNSFSINQASRKTEFRLNIGKVMKQLRRQPVLTSSNGKVKYTDEQWAQVKRMGVACSTYLIKGQDVSSMLKVHFTFERP